jgi:hypothetical protein
MTERMTDPAAPIPEINENIKEYLKPDKEMYEQAQKEIEGFDKAFELKAAEVQQEKKRIYWNEIL